MYHVPAAKHRLVPLDMSSIPLVYLDAVARAGGTPIAIPNDPGGIAQLLQLIDGLLIVGGDDLDPRRYTDHPVYRPDIGYSVGRDETELQLARLALDRDLPLLGICRGHQVLNVALGGSLHQHLLDGVTTRNHSQYLSDRPDRVVWHDIKITPKSRLRRITGRDRQRVNSDHHQGIDRVGDGLTVTARSTDGVVEAIEGDRWSFAMGLQWHPERIMTTHPDQLKYFRAFVRAATKFRDT